MAKTTWLIHSDELKKKIDSRHLTYQAAANLAGISHATIVRLMKGDCFVTPKIAEKIIEAFGSKNDTRPIAQDLADPSSYPFAFLGEPEKITDDNPAESDENTATPYETAELDEPTELDEKNLPPAKPIDNLVDRFEYYLCKGATLPDFKNSINDALLRFERKGMALVRISNMAQVETGGYIAFLTFEPEY